MSRLYLEVAGELIAAIESGKLAPGSRLPPQRQFAHDKRIAASTASRVYAELVRRGLIIGEIGRGSFVRQAVPLHDPPLTEPTTSPIDLELVFPNIPETAERLGSSLKRMFDSISPTDAFSPMGAKGTAALRAASSSLLRDFGLSCDQEGLRFAANGRAGIAASLSVLTKPGDRFGVEALTYPVVKGLAARLGIQLVPIASDDHGAIPEAGYVAHEASPLAGFYLQPSLHSPLGVSMDDDRRRAWARLTDTTGLTIIEDAIYSFLAPGTTPLAALAPNRVIYVNSLSKLAAPGLSIGIVSAPPRLLAPLSAALRSGAWSAAAFAAAAATVWISDGVVAAIVAAKRSDASQRQAIAREILGSYELQSDGRSYHAWLPLPGPWRGEAFAAAALRRGIAITAGSAFAVTPGHSPAGVRLALAAPSYPALRRGLSELRELLEVGPIDDAE